MPRSAAGNVAMERAAGDQEVDVGRDGAHH